MVTCFRCFSKSQVVLSRRSNINGNDETMIRTRQCKKCKWKWKTMEILINRHDHSPIDMKVIQDARL